MYSKNASLFHSMGSINSLFALLWCSLLAHILVCFASLDPEAGVPNYFEKDRSFIYKRVPIFDNRGEDIICHMDAVYAFIEQVRACVLSGTLASVPLDLTGTSCIWNRLGIMARFLSIVTKESADLLLW